MSADLDSSWTPPDLEDDADGLDDGQPAQEEEERTPAFSTPEEFFTEFLSPHIQRRLGGSYTWCPEWWNHPEGISRIVAMWTAFEHLRWEGALGMSTWWLHHADPHLAVLMSKDGGPFAACKKDGHNGTALPPLPHHPAPAGLWEAAGYAEPGPEASPEADS
ncbi:DUF4913 domain-containing protein [Actinomadura sp. NPDC048394]|uniref:DUF4913 domain-containing protein n=1 Tax=Actinomadura sp. NPDC048394 TaxID=3158223 RepID=UPI0033E9DB8B